MDQIDAMFTYWGDHPPLHLMVESFFGIKGDAPASSERARIPSDTDLRSLVNMVKGL
jgi:hypothetical protein